MARKKQTVEPEQAKTIEVQIATVNAVHGLNVRDVPSMDGAILRILKHGETVQVTGQNEEGWTPVIGGYVRSEFIK